MKKQSEGRRLKVFEESLSSLYFYVNSMEQKTLILSKHLDLQISALRGIKCIWLEM